MSKVIKELVLPSHVSALCCVYNGPRTNVIVGLYEHVEGTTRTGAITVLDENMDVVKSNDEAAPVFDVFVVPEKRMGIVCSADGTAAQFDLDTLKPTCTVAVDTTSMCTSLSFFRNDTAFVTVTSSGKKALGSFENWESDKEINLAHAGEAWCCETFDENVYGTGADDAALMLWDRRTSSATRTVRHPAGVTCIRRDPTRPSDDTTTSHLFFTGCYDDRIRCWDSRAMKTPIHETNIGGGVWRIVQNSFQPQSRLFALASMYAGAHVVRCDDVKGFELVSTLEPRGDKSLTYGVGWVTETVVIVGSHYDNLVQLWDTTK
eukprot:PhF_6_TR38047/c0_g1_i1/m.56772/K17868/DPH7, RRT2; diphthine methyl ester acylhydrolase